MDTRHSDEVIWFHFLVIALVPLENFQSRLIIISVKGPLSLENCLALIEACKRTGTKLVLLNHALDYFQKN